MDKEWYWQGGFIGAVVLLALYLLVPSYYYFSLPNETRNDKGELAKVLPGWATSKKVNLGLDLQGGIHLVMEVDVDAALSAKAANRGTEIEDYLITKDIEGAVSRVVNKNQVQMKVPDGHAEAAEPIMAEYEDMELRSQEGNVFVYAFKPETIKGLRDGAIQQSIKAIRNRVDKFGVTEPTIARRGENHVLVQLPGFKDPAQAKELIGRTAQLKFQICDDDDRSLLSLKENLPDGVTLEYESGAGGSGVPYLMSTNQNSLMNFLAEKAPDDRVFALGRIEELGKETKYRTWLLHDRSEVTGEYLTDARVSMGDDAVDPKPYVSLTFNRRGGAIFERLTGENIKKRMAIVLDGIVDSAPVIQSKIGGGRAQITLGGIKSMDEILLDAQNLALVLKAGALPAPVTIAEQRSVGASLGPELIESGTTALLAGFILVVLFMILYYRTTGIIADVALLLNAVLILAALALFGASLTLPGIAGIVLTLGMAVDANVIINERVREELRTGKSPASAVRAGYERAFSAILDANVTTVLAGIVLMEYGTGPIRGFAVTLIIGILASMFTAIIVTRWLVDWVVTRWPEQLSI